MQPQPPTSASYAHPEVLVTTDWVDHHRHSSNVRLLEVDVDTSAYEQGHIPGAFGVNWTSQLCDRVRRDVLSPDEFSLLCKRLGIQPDTTLVFYGDNHNWFAAYALWQFRYYRHPESKLKLMNGGRSQWLADGRRLVKDVPETPFADYPVREPDPTVRAFREDIFPHLDTGAVNLIDTRSPAEYSGEVIAPPGMNESALRGGHIPGAISIPWADTLNEHGLFKPVDALHELFRERGLDFNKPSITYCRIGERSAHTWFVMRYLMGIETVANYDGSWTEWGNLIGAPIAKG